MISPFKISPFNRSSGVGGVAPSNTVAPLISGDTKIGNILTTTNGTWTGTTPITYTYQWKRGGVAISGATNNTYTTVNDDIGENITCTVTATNAFGSNTSTSNTIVVTPDNYVQLNGTQFINADNVVTDVLSINPSKLSIDIKIDNWSTYSQGIAFSLGDTNGDEFFYFWITTSKKIQSALKKAGVVQWRFTSFSDVNAEFSILDSEWFNISVEHNGTTPIIKINNILPNVNFDVSIDKTKWLANLNLVDNGRIGCINRNNEGNTLFFTGGLDNLIIQGISTLNFDNPNDNYNNEVVGEWRFYDVANIHTYDSNGF